MSSAHGAEGWRNVVGGATNATPSHTQLHRTVSSRQTLLRAADDADSEPQQVAATDQQRHDTRCH